MDIPIDILVTLFAGIFTASGAVIAFVFRVVFGLIEKNKVSSDEEDHKLGKKLDVLEEKFTRNDRELYKDTASIREESAYRRGFDDGKKNNDKLSD